ncbi:MAG: HPr family phosphocarrier protein [Oscillospiraceae bacterium]|nr:HPr family phosphocarrier protein [Oscillospiraceae bacterium]
MKSVNILLPDVAAVKLFVNIVEQCDFDADLVSGRYRINAKSMMGIFSLGAEGPVTLELHTEDEKAANQLLGKISPFIVD